MNPHSKFLKLYIENYYNKKTSVIPEHIVNFPSLYIYVHCLQVSYTGQAFMKWSPSSHTFLLLCRA